MLALLTVFAGLVYYAYGTYGKVTKARDTSKVLVSMYMNNSELATARKITLAMANPKTQANVIATAEQWGNFTLKQQQDTQFIGQPYTEYQPPRSNCGGSSDGGQSDAKSEPMDIPSAEVSKMMNVMDAETDLCKSFMAACMDDSLVPGSQTLSDTIDLTHTNVDLTP